MAKNSHNELYHAIIHFHMQNYTLSLNSISALYPVFSQFIVTTPPNSIVSVPIKIPGKQQ